MLQLFVCDELKNVIYPLKVSISGGGLNKHSNLELEAALRGLMPMNAYEPFKSQQWMRQFHNFT